MQNNIQYIEEDKIDLGKLFFILKKRKKLIWSLTVVFTLLALTYSFFIAKPVYEVKVVMEMAQIKKKPVQNIIDLKQRIEVIFEVNAKGKEIEFPLVSGIDLPKKTTNIMTIHTQGYSNSTAEQKLQEVISYIVLSQDKELDSYTKIQKKRLALTEKDIIRNKELIVEIKKDINNYEKKLLNISKQDAALAGIYTIETGKKQTELNNATSKVYSLENKKNDLELSISPLKIQKATTIGSIEVLDNPIKPKKKLIIIVAFITGLMLSIFLAFFLEFIRGSREEEKQM